MTTEEIMQKIVEANILDQYDIATIERGLVLQDAYNQILDDSIAMKNPTTGIIENKFGLQYQVGQNFGKNTWKGRKVDSCDNCAKCLKNVSLSGGLIAVSYSCTRTNQYTYKLNRCDYFEPIGEQI